MASYLRLTGLSLRAHAPSLFAPFRRMSSEPLPKVSAAFQNHVQEQAQKSTHSTYKIKNATHAVPQQKTETHHDEPDFIKHLIYLASKPSISKEPPKIPPEIQEEINSINPWQSHIDMSADPYEMMACGRLNFLLKKALKGDQEAKNTLKEMKERFEPNTPAIELFQLCPSVLD